MKIQSYFHSRIETGRISHADHVAIYLDGSLHPSPMPGLSYFDGQFFYYKKKQGA